MWMLEIPAMVCSRGESLTHHINQINFFNVIAAAAVIGASFVTARPSEARNGWVYVGTDIDGDAHYAKVDSYAGKYVNLQVAVQLRMNPYPMTIDYKKWSKTFQSNGGGWSPIYPGTMAATNARPFCC